MNDMPFAHIKNPLLFLLQQINSKWKSAIEHVIFNHLADQQ
jgi:hypothetical protein